MFVWVWIFLKTHTNIINNKKTPFQDLYSSALGFVFVWSNNIDDGTKLHWRYNLVPSFYILYLYQIYFYYHIHIKINWEINLNPMKIIILLWIIQLERIIFVWLHWTQDSSSNITITHTYNGSTYFLPPIPPLAKKKTIYFWNKWNGLINIFSLTFVCEKLMADAFFNPKNTIQCKISFHTPFWVQWSKYRMNEYFTQ